MEVLKEVKQTQWKYTAHKKMNLSSTRHCTNMMQMPRYGHYKGWSLLPIIFSSSLYHVYNHNVPLYLSQQSFATFFINKKNNTCLNFRAQFFQTKECLEAYEAPVLLISILGALLFLNILSASLVSSNVLYWTVAPQMYEDCVQLLEICGPSFSNLFHVSKKISCSYHPYFCVSSFYRSCQRYILICTFLFSLAPVDHS